jgi:superoxide reductase
MSDAPVLSGINRVPDPAAAGDFENKHTPNLSLSREGGKLLVHVSMGHGVAHPNQPDHFIEWIELLANDAPIARFDFAAVAVDPIVTCVLDVEAATKLSAIASCNLHGLWAFDAVAP